MELLPPWSDLPADVLGQVLAGIPLPADRIRFRAVCRSWRSAKGWQLPWIVHRDGTFVTLPDGGLHRLPLPDNNVIAGVIGPHRLPLSDNDAVSVVGATNGWLALDCAVVGDEHARAYMLHDPFSNMTLPLPVLDSVIPKASESFEIRKVLMRSTPDDVIVVTTNNWYYPVIVCRAGKVGAWIPEPGEMPYGHIIDVEFLGDRLYGITCDEELVSLDLDEDDKGTPTVSSVKYIIKHPSSAGDMKVSTNNDKSEEEDEEGAYNEGSSVEEEEEDNASGHDDTSDVEEETGDDVATDEEETGDDVATEEEETDDDEAEINYMAGDAQIPDNELLLLHDKGDPTPRDHIENSWRLLESNGKLLMVRRQKCSPPYSREYNVSVEVLEANMNAGSWVPSTALGPGNGRTLFISKRFCKSVPTSREGFEYYFVNEHDVLEFNPMWYYECYDTRSTWVFPKELAP